MTFFASSVKILINQKLMRRFLPPLAALLLAISTAPAGFSAVGCDLDGRVVARDGGPVAGARLSLAGTGRDTTSDAEGRFCLDGLEPGGYRLVP